MGRHRTSWELMQDYNAYLEPMGVVLYFILCLVIYFNCQSVEARLIARLNESRHVTSGIPSKTNETETGGRRRGRAGKDSKQHNLLSVSLTTIRNSIVSLLMWLSTRKVKHYGKLEWRDITYLLWYEGNKDGLYVVSECIPHEGCYELAVCLAGTVHRYLIKYDKRSNLYGIHESSQFSDLYGVVAHYHSQAHGLCCRLERNAWSKEGIEMIMQRNGTSSVPSATST